MKIAVLGGLGLQGRAAIWDLAAARAVGRVICADLNPEQTDALEFIPQKSKVTTVGLDASDTDELSALLASVDLAVDLLPRQYCQAVCRAAITTATHVVNTNYAAPVAHLDAQARSAGVALLCECGLDPGIDLVLYALAGEFFDRLSAIRSYCGGIPEAEAADNPLRYKVSWNWEGVLSSTMRDARLMVDGRVVDIPALHQHDPEFVHEIDFPGLGRLEAIPNGDAVAIADYLGIGDQVRENGRYSLRWPGWSAFWRPLKHLGFFSTEAVPGLPAAVSPYQMLDKLLAPQLQYEPDQKDLAAMVNEFEGLKGGRRVRLTTRLVIERDLATGLTAMSQGVGIPASIAAQMVLGGDILARGVLTPARHVPCRAFLDELARRGIGVDIQEEDLPRYGGG